MGKVKILYSTIRGTDEDWGIEVRLSDGQKWTMITIDNRIPDAEKIADAINNLINEWGKTEPELTDETPFDDALNEISEIYERSK